VKHNRVVIGLAFAALFFAILLPPEAYPDGKLAVILCATFAFFISVSEKRIHPTYLLGGLALFALLIVHTALFSVDAFRSFDFISILWAYYCLFGFFFYVEFEPLKPLAICIVALCAIVSAYGLYQYFWGFNQLYNYVFYASSNQLMKVPALERIASARVFSTLALPGTLWGFLTVALPFHALLWRESRWAKVALSAGIGMLLVTGLLTRSFGFLVGLFVLAAAWLLLRHRQLAWRLAPIVVVLAATGGAFYSMRKVDIAGSNPLVLRAMNWVSAWTIFAAHPMGTGLNNYGIVYSQHMLPGANETQYAHNTPLQLLAELGYPALIGAAILLLLGLRAWRRGEYQSASPYVVFALIVWVLHNLIDIDVYFPSMGVLGTLLLAVLLKKPTLSPQPSSRIGSLAAVAFGGVVLVFSSLAMVSTELQQRAQMEYDRNDIPAAALTLEQARTLMPWNSSLFHDSGDINLALYHKRHDLRDLETATASFQRAIALSPDKIGPHVGLGLCLSTANHVDDALEEIRVAKRLQPDSDHVQAIARLLEKRNAAARN
jgi:tetratricopeptide (TPR) repeat protein